MTFAKIVDEVEIAIDPSASEHADWLNFEDPVYHFLQKLVVISDPNPNNEGRTVHQVRAIELVMPDNWDEAPKWMYGVKEMGRYGRPSTSPLRWFEADQLMKPEHQYLVGGVEF